MAAILLGLLILGFLAMVAYGIFLFILFKLIEFIINIFRKAKGLDKIDIFKK